MDQNRAKLGEALMLTLRLGLGALFIIASVEKIWQPNLFVGDIANYKILPISLLHISAILIPWLELVCGLALIVNARGRSANLILLGMISVFTLAVISALWRGLDISCGCFHPGSTENTLTYVKVLQNLAIIGAGVLLERFYRVNTGVRPIRS